MLNHTGIFSVYNKFHREGALHLSCHCIRRRTRVGSANDVYNSPVSCKSCAMSPMLPQTVPAEGTGGLAVE